MTATNASKQFNFTEAQVAKLCKMQDDLNTYIHPEWKSQGFDWAAAIVDEGQEILGHLGWKWWKDNTYMQGVTEANKAQIKLELIDILHFVLSHNIERRYSSDTMLWALNSSCTAAGRDLYREIQRMQQTALTIGRLGGELVVLMHMLDLTEQEILETYTQKYVLNKFRQDHGYKDGSYVKIWELEDCLGGLRLEDNEVLTKEVKHMEIEGQDTTDEIELYNRLKLRYDNRLNK